MFIVCTSAFVCCVSYPHNAMMLQMDAHANPTSDVTCHSTRHAHMRSSLSLSLSLGVGFLGLGLEWSVQDYDLTTRRSSNLTPELS